MAKQTAHISDKLLDELLGGEDPRDVFRSGKLIEGLKKAVAERALNAEMEAHLEGNPEPVIGNHRNGHNHKRILSDDGGFELVVPRDRLGQFEPQLIAQYVRRLPGFDDKVISMYAWGMTTREIRGHVEELYGVAVSAELISKVTDAVHEEVRQWQTRPLESIYAIVYFDAVRVKIRDEGVVQNKAVYPQATVQTCIVHLIRYSLAHGSWKERKPLAAALRLIYRAPTVAAVKEELEAFEAGPWGQKYPAIARSWRSCWEQIIPFFAFSEPIRRAIYTTNAIESLNSTVRRAVRTRGHFPHDRAATKLLFLALRNVERSWRAPPVFWHQARIECTIQFGTRFAMVAT